LRFLVETRRQYAFINTEYVCKTATNGIRNKGVGRKSSRGKGAIERPRPRNSTNKPPSSLSVAG